MPLTEAHVADLVAALLTVNQYPLDRAVSHMPAFKAAGLLDPAHVAALKQEELIAALNQAGYARGGFVPILAFRLYPLMDAIAEGRLDGLNDAAGRGDKDAFFAALTALHGFGPRTAATAWELWTAG